jgi:hypothetical protein
MRRIARFALAPAVATILIAGAPAAQAASSSAEAKKLASDVVAAAKKLHGLRVKASGDLYYCPGVRGAFLLEPSTGCTKKATSTYTLAVSKGKITGGSGRTTAGGEKAVDFISRSSGTYHRVDGETCWTRVDPTPRFFGPAFSFLPDEKLSISSRTSKSTVLRGEIAKSGFKELATISRSTKHVSEEKIYQGTRRSVYAYTALSSTPKPPEPSPAC